LSTTEVQRDSRDAIRRTSRNIIPRARTRPRERVPIMNRHEPEVFLENVDTACPPIHCRKVVRRPNLTEEERVEDVHALSDLVATRRVQIQVPTSSHSNNRHVETQRRTHLKRRGRGTRPHAST
jgi:hypothetical protein